LEDLKSADCVVVFGADLVRNHMVSGFFIKRNIPKGMVLIVVDPNKNEMESIAHYTLQPIPGSDKHVIEGLVSAISALGLGKEPVTDEINSANLASSSKACGVPRDLLVAVGREIACAQRPVFILGKGLIKARSTGVLQSLAGLAKFVHAKALINTKGKANSSAAQLLKLDRQAQMDNVSAAFIDLGDDQVPARLIERVNGLPFITVMASYASELTNMADVVLPVETCFEQNGHYINVDGRVQAAHRAINPPLGVESNTTVLARLANELGINIASNWETILTQANN
jgi:formate dehydrogenase major subunit